MGVSEIVSATRIEDALSEHQLAILRRVVGEEESRREHVVVYLSGAHAYGFPSPDSDLDLKAVHLAKTSELLGLTPPTPTFDRAEVLDGVEVDYTSNELGHALAGVLLGNGNFIERFLGRMVAHASPLAAQLAPLVKRSLSRHVFRHYKGFAQNQLRFLEKEPTAKKLLYVLRTTLTGTHLLQTGELEADLVRLMDRHGVGDARDLIAHKRAGERMAIDPSLVATWRPRIDALFATQAAAYASTSLPDEPTTAHEMHEFLIDVRRSRL